MTPVEAVVAAVVRLLPAGEQRERWRAELTAELAAVPEDHRAGYLVRLALRAPSLAVAVRSGPAPRPAGAVPGPGCRTGLHHRWTTYRTDDGSPYEACRRCGRDRPVRDGREPRLVDRDRRWNGWYGTGWWTNA